MGRGGFPPAGLHRSHLLGSFFSRSRLSRGVPSCAGAAATAASDDGGGGGDGVDEDDDDDVGSCVPRRKCKG